MDLRRSRLFILLLIAITAIGPLSLQIFVPALPAIQQGFGVSVATAQLALSLSTFAIAVATLFGGPFSDRYGRRPVVLVGLGIFLAGTLACALAPDIWSLIVGRIVQAAGGAISMTIARAMVRDLFDREQSATVLANLTMAMVLAPMLAPVIGGVLIDLVGWRANFVFVGLVGVAVAFGVARRMAETRLEAVPFSGLLGMAKSFWRLLRRPLFCGFALQSSFSLAVFFAFLAGGPYVVVTVLGRPATEYGLYFMVLPGSFMVGNFITSRIAQRVGLERMVLAGSLLSFAGAVLLVALLLAGFWTPLAIFGASGFVAFAQGLSMASSQAGALSVEPRLAGAAAGLAGFLQMFTAAAVAQLVGMIHNGTPYPMALSMLACALLALASFVVPLRLAGHRIAAA